MARAGLRAERRDAALAALAAAHGRPAAVEVDVVHAQADDLTGAHPGLGHQAHDRLVAAVAEVLAAAGFDQPAQLVVGERVDDFGVELGCLEPEQGIGVDLALFLEPGGEAAHGELAGPGGGGFGAGVEQIGDERFDQLAVQGGGVAVLVRTSSGSRARRRRRP